MSTTSSSNHGGPFWFGIAVGIATLLALVVAVVVALFGDSLFDRWFSDPQPSAAATTDKGKLLSDGPVKVFWTGDGETLEVRWEPMSDPELDHYSVDVYGLYPVESWVNNGYRPADKLDTFRVIHPVADTKTYNEDSKVAAGETWRICVTGMRETPGGVDVTPYIIKDSKRCSETFTVPS